jgi:hypothetical protein
MAAPLALMALTACGLDRDGLLATAGALAPGATSGDDPGNVQTTVDGSLGDEPLESGGGSTSDDAAGGASKGDGGAGSSSNPPSTDASDTGAPSADGSACAVCGDVKCPTQVAACGSGSDCVKFRDCQIACASSGSTCLNACGASYPAGQTDFGSLTLCSVSACGADCVASLATGQ